MNSSVTQYGETASEVWFWVDCVNVEATVLRCLPWTAPWLAEWIWPIAGDWQYFHHVFTERPGHSVFLIAIFWIWWKLPSHPHLCLPAQILPAESAETAVSISSGDDRDCMTQIVWQHMKQVLPVAFNASRCQPECYTEFHISVLRGCIAHPGLPNTSLHRLPAHQFMMLFNLVLSSQHNSAWQQGSLYSSAVCIASLYNSAITFYIADSISTVVPRNAICSMWSTSAMNSRV